MTSKMLTSMGRSILGMTLEEVMRAAAPTPEQEKEDRAIARMVRFLHNVREPRLVSLIKEVGLKPANALTLMEYAVAEWCISNGISKSDLLHRWPDLLD